jgi:hypothetical protein
VKKNGAEGVLKTTIVVSFIYRGSGAFSQIYESHCLYTWFTKQIDLPQIGTNRALILFLLIHPLVLLYVPIREWRSIAASNEALGLVCVWQRASTPKPE